MNRAVFQRLAGKFIVFDGIDGAGKGAQLDRLEANLRAAGVAALRTRDPGGTVIGDRIRHVLLDYDLSQMDVRCEAFLFMASRAQLCREVVAPALLAKKAILGDRFVSATCAYQGAAGYDPHKVIELARFAIEDVWPHLTIVIDLPHKEAFRRTNRSAASARPAVEGQSMLFHDVRTDAMESRPEAFHARVRELFLELPSYYPAPVAIVNGEGSVEDVEARVVEAIASAAL